MSPPQLPYFITVSPTAIPGILNSLCHWSEALPSKTVSGMLSQNDTEDSVAFCSQRRADPNALRSFLSGFKTQDRAEIQLLSQQISMASDEEIISSTLDIRDVPCPGIYNPTSRAQWLASSRTLMLYGTAEGYASQTGYHDTRYIVTEARWHEETEVFLPPPLLRQKYHVDFDRTWIPMREGGRPPPQLGQNIKKVLL